MPKPIKELRRMQYLGTHNWIVKLRWFNYGWRMIDFTGAVYKQTDYPDGFHVWTHKPTEKQVTNPTQPKTPWPPKPPVETVQKQVKKPDLLLTRVTQYVWCDHHNGIHQRKSDPFMDGTFCHESWRALFVHARPDERESF